MAEKEFITKLAARTAIENYACLDCVHSNGKKCEDCEYQDCINFINEVKATDVQPIKHGRWDFQGYQLFKCTNCTKIYTQEQLEDIGENWAFPNFCPNCGARMDGEQND